MRPQPLWPPSFYRCTCGRGRERDRALRELHPNVSCDASAAGPLTTRRVGGTGADADPIPLSSCAGNLLGSGIMTIAAWTCCAARAPEWQKPLFETLTRRGVSFAPFDLTRAAFTNDDAPGARVYFNQASPSAYLRGHTRAVPLALASCVRSLCSARAC